MTSMPTMDAPEMATIRTATELTYRLDTGLKIIALDDAWTPFAIENDAPELAAPAPLGRSILSYISDPTTEHIYRDVFAETRRRGRMSIPLRCDSPSLRRYLRLDISTTADSGFEIRSRVLKAEARPTIPFLEATDRHPDQFIRCCSWCKRFDVAGRWAEVEVAIDRLRLFDMKRPPQISHGMCEACVETMDGLLAG